MVRRIIGIGMILWLVWVVAACSNDDGDDSSESSEPTTQLSAVNNETQVESRPKVAFSDYQDELLATAYDPAEPLGDFTLESTTGEPFSLSQGRGKFLIFYFGYMNCPDVCPTTLAQLRQAYLNLGEPADQLGIYFVTVDPERDSLDDMQSFLGLWSEDFVGLYGEGDILQSALDEFDVIAIKREVADSAVGYLMDHSGDVYIVDTDGRLVAKFIHGVTASTIEHDLRIILDNEF